MKHINITLILLLFLSISAKAQTRITEKELSKHISILTSDDFNAEQEGKNGTRNTVEYIRKEFENSGLQLYKETGIQSFEVITGIKADSTNRLKIGNKNAKQERDFMPLAFSGSARINAGIAFVGFGLAQDTVENRKGSYDGIDVKGKWVLIIRGNIDYKYNDAKVDYQAKVKLAEKHGAAGVLFVSDSEANSKDELTQLEYERGLTLQKIPVIHVRRVFADRIMQMEGRVPINKQAKFIRKNKKPNSFITHVSAFANIKTKFVKKRTQNIIAELKGQDPYMAKKYILVSLGYNFENFCTNIAVDSINTSTKTYSDYFNIATILELSEYFSSVRNMTDYSLIFVVFGAKDCNNEGMRKFLSENQKSNMFDIEMGIDIDSEEMLLSDKPIVVFRSDESDLFPKVKEIKDSDFFDLQYLSNNNYTETESLFNENDISYISLNIKNENSSVLTNDNLETQKKIVIFFSKLVNYFGTKK